MVQNWDRVNVVPVVRAQDSPENQPKFVEIEPNSHFEAVRVVKVAVGEQEVTPGPFNRREGPSGIAFHAGDDWLKTLVFTIKNRSTKKIVQIQWSVCFPEPGSINCLLERTTGRMPEIDAYTKEGVKLRPGSQQPLDLRPRQVMKISLADYADDLRTRIEQQQPFSNTTRCFINVYLAYFEDGMNWTVGGYYSVPDPSHPGLFKRVDASDDLIDPEA